MAIRWTERPSDDPLPRLPPDAAGPAAAGEPDLWVAPAAERIVLAHLGLAEVERGGLLLGDAWQDGERGGVAHVRIVESIPADEAAGTAVSLRMDAAVWSRARERLRPGLRIVGWYHSHPGLTAFFSDTDRRTQRAVFHHRWSIGWVIDPFEPDSVCREAFFAGPDSRPIPRRPAPRIPEPAQ